MADVLAGELAMQARLARASHLVGEQIHPEKIGMVIGKGGETIRSLEADYEVQIDIEEDGNYPHLRHRG